MEKIDGIEWDKDGESFWVYLLGKDDKDLYRKINTGIINFPFNFSLELKNLLTEIFQFQSKNRITCE